MYLNYIINYEVVFLLNFFTSCIFFYVIEFWNNSMRAISRIVMFHDNNRNNPIHNCEDDWLYCVVQLNCLPKHAFLLFCSSKSRFYWSLILQIQKFPDSSRNLFSKSGFHDSDLHFLHTRTIKQFLIWISMFITE